MLVFLEVEGAIVEFEVDENVVDCLVVEPIVGEAESVFEEFVLADCKIVESSVEDSEDNETEVDVNVNLEERMVESVLDELDTLEIESDWDSLVDGVAFKLERVLSDIFIELNVPKAPVIDSDGVQLEAEEAKVDEVMLYCSVIIVDESYVIENSSDRDSVGDSIASMLELVM